MECDITFIDKKHLDKKGKYVFRKTESQYVGYALFKPSDLKLLHDRLRLYPVKAGADEHCGMFFLDSDGRILSDDLTAQPYTLRTLRSLCDLLADKLVLGRL